MPEKKWITDLIAILKFEKESVVLGVDSHCSASERVINDNEIPAMLSGLFIFFLREAMLLSFILRLNWTGFATFAKLSF